MTTRKERNNARSQARYEARRPLLAQIKAQAARIAELEEALAMMMNERITKLAAQRDALLAACEAALEAIRSDADVDWMLSVESQLCVAIAGGREGEDERDPRAA